MKCEKCEQDFPSIYYFKTDTLCLDCFKKMTPDEQQAAVYKQLMKYPMTTTTFTIEGFNIVKQLGVVRGITVRSRSIFGTIGGDTDNLWWKYFSIYGVV